MRRVMDLGRPVLAVDGSNDTRRLLPRLGWREVGRAMRFVRLLRVDSLRRELRRRLWMRQAERRSALGRLGRIREQLLVRLFRPGSPRPPAGGAALCATSLDEGVRAAYDDRVECGTLPLPLPAQIDWLARAATPGRCFACLNFRIDGVLRGWGLIRVDEVGETVEAALLELFSPEPALYDWMVGEAVAIAAGLGAHRITSISSCPTLALALRRNHFWAREQTPIHCWVERGVFPLAPLHLGLNIGDAALLPYPRPWPSYASVAGA
jgi:hypothetical protein